jgi:hypothetical protein
MSRLRPPFRSGETIRLFTTKRQKSGQKDKSLERFLK